MNEREDKLLALFRQLKRSQQNVMLRIMEHLAEDDEFLTNESPENADDPSQTDG